MSLDLFEKETGEAMSRLAPAPVAETGAWDGFARGTALTTMQGLAKTGRAIDLLGSVGPIAQDAFTGGTEAQDRYFAEHDAIWGNAVDYWTPNTREVGVAAQIAGTLISTLPLVLASPSLAVGSAQLSAAEDLLQKGVGAGEAQAVGAIQGAGLGLGIYMPIFGRTLLERVFVGGAGFGVAQGIGMRAASEAILKGTPGEGDYHAFDRTSLMLDFLLNAAFGGITHMSPSQRAQGSEMWNRIESWAKGLQQGDIDALAVLRQAQHMNVDSMPGKPAEPVDVERHVQRVRTALEQMLRDEPVEVSDLPMPRMEIEQTEQTQLPAFKEWFGDSKVVDENGKPVVVYHGTVKDFTAFDPESIGSGAWNDVGLGRENSARAGTAFYMTSSKDHAASFGHKTMSLYASVKNPLTVDAYKILNDYFAETGGNEKKGINEWLDGFYGNTYQAANADDLFNEAIKQAKKHGHDGVIVDFGLWPETNRPGSPLIGKIVIAFRPEQIKSAIGNSGRFDPNNPDIADAISPSRLREAEANVKVLAQAAEEIRQQEGLAPPPENRPSSSVEQWRATLSETDKALMAKVAGLEQIYAKAVEVDPQFSEVLRGIASKTGTRPIVAPIKGLARAIEKINADYGGNAALIKDLVRGTLVAETHEQALAAVEIVREKMKVVGTPRIGIEVGKPAPSTDGYRDAKLNVEINGHVAEVQVNIPEMIAAKEAMHSIYEERDAITRKVALAGRDLTAAEAARREALNTQMRTAYDAAWERALAKKASADIAVPFRSTEEIGNQRDSGLSQARAAAPEGSTLTGTPSTSKNFVPLGKDLSTGEIIPQRQEPATVSEAPAAKRGGAEPPPPRGTRGADVAGAEGKAVDPIQLEAERFVSEHPDLLLSVGKNADGSPILQTAREYLDEARLAADNAREDVGLFEAAARCLLGMA